MNRDLAERVRAGQNFVEYVPLLLILMALIEINGGSAPWLHSTGTRLT